MEEELVLKCLDGDQQADKDLTGRFTVVSDEFWFEEKLRWTLALDYFVLLLDATVPGLVNDPYTTFLSSDQHTIAPVERPRDLVRARLRQFDR